MSSVRDPAGLWLWATTKQCVTFSLHLPEVELRCCSVATPTEGVYDSIVDVSCRPQLSAFHPVHGVEYDVVIAVHPVRRLLLTEANHH